MRNPRRANGCPGALTSPILHIPSTIVAMIGALRKNIPANADASRSSDYACDTGDVSSAEPVIFGPQMAHLSARSRFSNRCGPCALSVERRDRPEFSIPNAHCRGGVAQCHQSGTDFIYRSRLVANPFRQSHVGHQALSGYRCDHFMAAGAIQHYAKYRPDCGISYNGILDSHAWHPVPSAHMEPRDDKRISASITSGNHPADQRHNRRWNSRVHMATFGLDSGYL